MPIKNTKSSGTFVNYWRNVFCVAGSVVCGACSAVEPAIYGPDEARYEAWKVQQLGDVGDLTVWTRPRLVARTDYCASEVGIIHIAVPPDELHRRSFIESIKSELRFAPKPDQEDCSSLDSKAFFDVKTVMPSEAVGAILDIAFSNLLGRPCPFDGKHCDRGSIGVLRKSMIRAELYQSSPDETTVLVRLVLGRPYLSDSHDDAVVIDYRITDGRANFLKATNMNFGKEK